MMIAAVYARKSTDEPGVHEDAKSVTRQVERGREAATTLNCTVADEHLYVDDNMSGAEFSKRPGLVRLLASLSPKPSFQWLIISEQSRLGRESFETGYVLKQLLSSGVRIWMYLDGKELTLTSASDKILLAVSGVIDDMEREKARQRTRDALLRKAKAGHVVGGKVFGYRNVEITENGKRSHVVREIIPEEAAVVRRIFDLTIGGRTDRVIVETLTAEHAPTPTPRGKNTGTVRGWTCAAVRAIRRNPLYHGEQVWNRRQVRDEWGKKHLSARDREEWVRVDVPHLQIISDDLWNRVQSLLTARSQAHKDALLNGGKPPARQPSPYLLGGLLQCGVCGSGLIVRSRGRGAEADPGISAGAIINARAGAGAPTG